MEKIIIKSKTIKLSQFLKWAGLVETGGHAKELILAGEVQVNGILEKIPGKQIITGDIVSLNGQSFLITNDEK